MHHSDFALVGHYLRGKAFAAILVGLCIIVSFCPQTAELAPINGSNSPGFSSSNNIAFLPAPIQVEGELCTLKFYENVACKRTPAVSREILLTIYGLVSPTCCDNGIYLVYFSGTNGADFKIVCQLLNLPPPFALS